MSNELTIKQALEYMKDKLEKTGVRDYEEDAFLLLNCVRELSRSNLLLNGDDTLSEQERIK